MTFPSALTSSQLATLESSTYWASTRALVTPHRVVLRAVVQTTPTGVSYAAIGYHNVTIGSAAAVRVGMTVYVGNGTEIADAVFVGRVRKAPTSGQLFINETSAALTAGMTITVLDEYRVWERLQRVDRLTNARFKDFDVTFQQLSPTISGLQSAYWAPAGQPIAFSPQARAHVPSATIASWSWEIADGTFVVGSPSSQTVEVSFPAGHRWVRLTVTDSGGRSAFIAVEVFSGDVDSQPWSLAARSVNVACDLDSGWRADLEVLTDAELWHGQRVTLLTFEPHAPIVSRVSFVGTIAEFSQRGEADPRAVARRWVTLQLEGFASQVARILQPGLTSVDRASPGQWGEIAQLDIVRALVYAIQWHTTLQNVCAIEFAPTLEGYRYSDLSYEAETALEGWRTCAAQANGALTWAATGVWLFERDAAYLPASARNALPTIATLNERHLLSVTVNETPQPRAGQLVAGFGGYNTSDQTVRVIQAKAPAEAALQGGESETLNSQILLADQTIAQWRDEAAQRVGDALAALNQRFEAEIELVDSWWWLVPRLGAWVGLTLTDRSALLGWRAQRWQLVSIQWADDAEARRRAVQATLRAETVGGSSMTVTAVIPQTGELENPVLPSMPDYPFTPPDPNLNYSAPPSRRSRQAIVPADISYVQPIPPQAADEPRRIGCRNITLLATSVVSSGFVLQNAQPYEITVRGNGLVQGARGPRWVTDWDFTQAPHGQTPSLFTPMTWVAGEGWRVNASGGMILLTPTTTTPVQVSFFEYTFSAPVGDGIVEFLLNPPVVSATENFVAGQQRWARDVSHGIRRMVLRVNSISSSVYLRRLRIFSDVEPTWGATFEPAGGAIDADAFYRDLDTPSPVAWAGLGGLYINSAPALTAPPQPLNPNHEYTFQYTGIGMPLTFTYAMPAPARARAVPFFITICGPGA